MAEEIMPAAPKAPLAAKNARRLNPPEEHDSHMGSSSFRIGMHFPAEHTSARLVPAVYIRRPA